MLKFFFLCLLLANGLLFAFHQGHLEKLFPSGREPARVANQLNADQFKLMPASAVADSASASTPAAAVSSASVAVNPEQNLLACTEIGNFTTAEANRFEARLAGSAMSGKWARRPVQETSSHMILISSQESKDGADKKVTELRSLGVTDFYIMPDNIEQRWGISLGIFKTEEAARMRLAALTQQGVQNARLIEYKVPLSRVAFQMRDLDDQTQGAIDKIKAEFPRQEVRSCG